MKNKMIKTSIEFGGFYGESIHNLYIENLINDDHDNIDWNIIENNYIKKYCYLLSSFISKKYNLDFNFKNISLYSPEFYNYETDTIDCQITNEQVNRLNKIFLNDDYFIQHLKQRTKSYDGYISYYTFEQAKNNKDNILIRYVLEYICINKFNKIIDINDFLIDKN
tara:strand:+ start:234 stop:731 length:498 start_codon:yes stop_codon:yes gene_type:complete